MSELARPFVYGGTKVSGLLVTFRRSPHHVSEQHMQYDNPSASFHQNGLGQALGTHLPAYNRTTTDYRHPSNSPPSIPHATASSSLTYTVQQATSPAMKRKQVDPIASANKRRRETGADDADAYDMDGNQQGAKHWTDEEKSRLFNWLMGPGQEDHWNALRATKNSCLREVPPFPLSLSISDITLVRRRGFRWEKDLSSPQRMLRAQL